MRLTRSLSLYVRIMRGLGRGCEMFEEDFDRDWRLNLDCIADGIDVAVKLS